MKFQLLLPLLVSLAFLFGCDSTKDVSSQTNPKIDIPGKIMVLLDSAVNSKKLEKEMSAYDLKNEGQISRAETRFMFSFDQNKISSKKLIQKINALSYASQAAVPQELDR